MKNTKHASPEHALTAGGGGLYGGKDSTFNGAEQLVITEVIEVNSIGAENRSLDIPETLLLSKGHGRSRTNGFKEVVMFGNSGRTLVVRHVPLWWSQFRPSPGFD